MAPSPCDLKGEVHWQEVRNQKTAELVRGRMRRGRNLILSNNITVITFSFTWQIQFAPINNHYYGVEERRLKKI